MPTYISVVKWDVSNRVTKFQEHATLAAAQAHATLVGGTYPGAYAVESPGGSPADWVANSGGGTLTSSPDLALLKKRRIAEIGPLLISKLALGWTYGGKVYQVTDPHLRNLERFINALNFYVGEIPGWLTVTAYVAGDRVRVAKVFYVCLENHTSGVWLTDLAAAKWAVWYFHPYKGGDGKWRALDNSANALTLAQARDMCEGAINYEAHCRAQAVVHKDGINACANVAAVNAYDLTAGWPANS